MSLPLRGGQTPRLAGSFPFALTDLWHCLRSHAGHPTSWGFSLSRSLFSDPPEADSRRYRARKVQERPKAAPSVKDHFPQQRPIRYFTLSQPLVQKKKHPHNPCRGALFPALCLYRFRLTFRFISIFDYSPQASACQAKFQKDTSLGWDGQGVRR